MNRRSFLKTTIMGLGVGSGFASNLAAFNAFADVGSEYKALVCVFLFGGVDGHDTIIPHDQMSYEQFQRIRAPILEQYDLISPRRRQFLLQLDNELDGRRFALPPEMTRLHGLYQNGAAAVVGNIGPLVEPIDRHRFLAGSAKLPAKLFSHNDQRSVWMSSQPEGARTGWGGRFADVLKASEANANSAFSTISINRDFVFLNGEATRPLVTSASGAKPIRGLEERSQFGESYGQVLRDIDVDRTNLFERDTALRMRASLNNNAILGEQLALPGDPMTEFPDSSLGQQLQMVARMIARKDSLGMKRQIFFVSAGGFDTHSDQAARLPELQRDLDRSIGSFYDSMIEMGLEQNVTTFTASDFGRTLGVNGDGTDHGWGGHHFVVGGGVSGGKIYGDIPPVGFGHDYDAGRGRLIPGCSVDEYAAALGRWFGLSNSDLIDAIPGLVNFDQAGLNDLFS